ncbi:hypothetical protein [Arsenicicoccus dermatophilus]|uniref:hypothetical protein n=1 Tax=Arsenicicoccus dermatophilus TaxID=1076331 RepID=UPI001F4CB7E4|nr:hypothetical protein [Arsenicicoccus dermatophilus]MCH8613442.1 hypothetical protein [Arsenicicoccus dermatophilus]
MSTNFDKYLAERLQDPEVRAGYGAGMNTATAHHIAVIDLAAPDNWKIECHAPADACCHIVWDCDCEEWSGMEIIDGVPWHDAGGGEPGGAWMPPEWLPEVDLSVQRHRGRFDPAECSLHYWAQEDEGNLHGEVRVPVKAEYGGGYYTFDAAQPTAENIRKALVHELYRPNAEDIHRAMAGEVLKPDPFSTETLLARQVKAVCALLGIPTEEQS